jgi:hypothetical protein
MHVDPRCHSPKTGNIRQPLRHLLVRTKLPPTQSQAGGAVPEAVQLLGLLKAPALQQQLEQLVRHMLRQVLFTSSSSSSSSRLMLYAIQA